MQPFRDIPIRGKLTVIITFTCCVALLLGGIALTARYAASEQHRLTERLLVLAKVTASNTSAAVAFQDPQAAHETLAALVADPSILAAYVLDSRGTPFARFTAPGRPDVDPAREAGYVAPAGHGFLLFRESFSVSSPIRLDGDEIGTVFIDADLKPLRLALLRDIGAFALIIFAAGLVALVLSARLQEIVSDPILRLARTMRHVSRVKDYSLRVDKHANDEVGVLIDGFNEMLEQIRLRDEQLRLAANALENTGDAIMITDARLRIVSVNKAFTTMTGHDRAAVVGKRPPLLRADRRDMALYANIWKQVRVRGLGQWQGELWGRRKGGEVYPQWVSISAVRDRADKVSHYVFVSNDISTYKQQEAQLAFLAHHDALTRLPNRPLFDAELAEALLRAKRRRDLLGLMFLDLDHFKKINDSLGHAVGDELLIAAATRIKGCLRESDMVARQGGDEFTVLLDGLRDVQDAASIARKIVAELARPFMLSGHELFISASVGIACYPQDGENAELLLRNADAAMYLAKERGRNSYQFHSDSAGVETLVGLKVADGPHGAVAHDELVLHYQAHFDPAAGGVPGVASPPSSTRPASTCACSCPNSPKAS